MFVICPPRWALTAGSDWLADTFLPVPESSVKVDELGFEYRYVSMSIVEYHLHYCYVLKLF